MMQLNKTWKIVVGLVTGFYLAAQLLVMAGVILMFFLGASGALDSAGSLSDDALASVGFLLFFGSFYATAICLALLQPVLAGFYTIHQVRNPSLGDWEKTFFILGNFMLPFLAMPLYYILRILLHKQPND